MAAENSSSTDDLQLFIQELEELEDLAVEVVQSYLSNGDCAEFKVVLEKLAVFLKIM